MMCDVDIEVVVNVVDVLLIYDIFKVLHCEGLDVYIVCRFGLVFCDVDWIDWDELLCCVYEFEYCVEIAFVGKYIDLLDVYLFVIEVLWVGGFD